MGRFLVPDTNEIFEFGLQEQLAEVSAYKEKRLSFQAHFSIGFDPDSA